MTRNKCLDGLNRGPWQPDEDVLLKTYIEANGVGRWSTLPIKAGLKRCGKSCRLRWMNHLRPNVKRGQISADEEELIIRLHKLLGNRWSLIAARVPGRTDNDVKNFWNIHLSKKLAPDSKAKDTSSSNGNGRGNSTTGKLNLNFSAQRHDYQIDAIAGQAESKPVDEQTHASVVSSTNSNARSSSENDELHIAVSASTTVESQQNSQGILSDISESAIQGLTTSHRCHADRMRDLDSFWFGSLPWLNSNNGDNLYCNYITDVQPKNLVSEFDIWDLYWQ